MADANDPHLPQEILTILPKDPTVTFDPARQTRALGYESIRSGTESPTEDGGRATLETSPGDPFPAPTAEAAPPFQLRRVIGRGGMGEVWEAVQGPLRRVVAVKVARADLLRRASEAQTRSLLDEFEREAATTAALEHPNIVPVYDLARGEDGAPLLAMKLVRGTPWDRALEADIDTLAPADVIARHVPILVDVAQAVAFAHSRGVVHRDLKPGQVMVGEYGEVLLMDWGLAVRPADAPAPEPGGLGDAAIPAASASSPAGTPAYMAPEQTASRADGIGTWTDVYLLGATLYHILTGTPPHLAATSHAAMMQAAIGRVQPPSERAPGRTVPPELEAIALRAMALEPAERHPSAKAFLGELEDWLTGAGKRRVSEGLAAEAKARLAAAPNGYRELADIGALAERALAEWPGNPALPALREDTCARHADLAMANGDLVLARVQAERLPDGERRATLLAEVERHDLRARRVARQRGTFLKATAALSLATVLVGAIAFAKSRQAQDAEYQKLVAQANADRATAAAQLDRELADVARRVNDLRRDEYALAEEVDGVFGAILPRVMSQRGNPAEAEGPDASSWATEEDFRADLEEVLARRDALLDRRRALEAQVGAGLDPPPIRLRVADAYRRLAFAEQPADFRDAYALLERLDRDVPDSPEVLSGLAVAAARLDSWTSARAAISKASEVTRRTRGEYSEAYIDSLSLQSLVFESGDADRSAAIASYEQAIRISETRLVQQLQTLGNFWLEAGRPGETERFARFALGFVDRLPDSQLRVGNLNSQLSVSLLERGRSREALPSLEAALAADERAFGRTHQRTIAALTNLASVQARLGDAARGVALRTEAIERARQLDPPNPGLVARLQVSLADLLLSLNRLDEAARLTGEAMATFESLPEDRTADLVSALHTYSTVLRSQGEGPRALEAIDRAIELGARAYPPTHISLRSAKRAKATTLAALGRGQEALALTREDVAFERAQDPNSLSYFEASMALVLALAGAGEQEEAARLAAEVSHSMKRAGLGDNVAAGHAAHWAAYLRGDLGDWEGALSFNLEALRIRRLTEGSVYGRNSIGSSYNTAYNLRNLDRYAEAVEYNRVAAEGFRQALGPERPEVAASASSYLDSLAEAGRAREIIGYATPLLPEIRAWPAPLERALAISALARAHEMQGNHAAAAPLWRESIAGAILHSDPVRGANFWATQRAIRAIAEHGNPAEAETLWLDGLRMAAEATSEPLVLDPQQFDSGLAVARAAGRPADALALAALAERQLRAPAAPRSWMRGILIANDGATSAALEMGDRDLAARYLRRAVAAHAAMDLASTATLSMRYPDAWEAGHGLGDFRDVREAHRADAPPASVAELLKRIRGTEFPSPAEPFDIPAALAARPALAEEAKRLRDAMRPSP